MYLEERRKKIIELLSENDTVSVTEFAKRFKVSLATIRSDLRYLDNKKLITRTHGGAMPLVRDSQTEQELLEGFTQRKEINLSEKISIAKIATTFIFDDDTIILDASSTCYELARLLKSSKKRLTIITNGIRTANLLKMNINITVILIGGILSGDSNSTKGLLGEDMLNSLNVDKVFFSAFGLSLDKGFSDKDLYEIELKQKMLGKAEQRYALIDSSKFNRVSLSHFLSPEDITTIITDPNLNYTQFKLYKNKYSLILSD